MLEENVKCLFLKIMDDYIPVSIESIGYNPVKFIYNVAGAKVEITYNPLIANENVIRPINWLTGYVPSCINFTPMKAAKQPQFILTVGKFEYSIPELSRIELAKVQDRFEEVYHNFAENQITNILNSIEDE